MSPGWVTLLGLWACAGGGSAPVQARAKAEDSAAAALDPQAWAMRASLDLRGTRLSAEERAAATDEAAVEALIDGWVASEAFATRAAWIWNSRVHSALFFESSTLRNWRAITEEQRRLLGWEPLELVHAIVAADRPFTDLVTATELPTHPQVAAVWGWAAAGEGWTLAAPPDARPAAGMLSSTSLWFVYDGDTNNFNRRRANAVSRIFLCEDFLARDVSFDADLSLEDLERMEDAIRSVPGCQACHAGLDPIAALLGGFAERSFEGSLERLGGYSPWTADWYHGLTQPAWFGHPVNGLEDLGQMIAADRRFARCAARTLAEGLSGAALPADAPLDDWTDHFIQSGYDLRALAAELTRSSLYRAPDERTLGPDQLASALAELLAVDPADTAELAWDLDLRLLAGGTDDTQVLEVNRVPGLGHQVALAWAARALVGPALEEDARRAEPAVWSVSPWTTEEAAVRAQLVDWHTRWLGEALATDDAAIDRLYALWQATGGAEDPTQAWTSALQALLRHPRSLLY